MFPLACAKRYTSTHTLVKANGTLRKHSNELVQNLPIPTVFSFYTVSGRKPAQKREKLQDKNFEKPWSGLNPHLEFPDERSARCAIATGCVKQNSNRHACGDVDTEVYLENRGFFSSFFSVVLILLLKPRSDRNVDARVLTETEIRPQMNEHFCRDVHLCSIKGVATRSQ